jgi:hypothetical protein
LLVIRTSLTVCVNEFQAVPNFNQQKEFGRT